MNVAYQLMDQLSAARSGYPELAMLGGNSENPNGSSFEATLREKTDQVRDTQKPQDAQKPQKAEKPQKNQPKTENKGEAAEAPEEQAEPVEEMPTEDRLSIAAALMAQGQVQLEDVPTVVIETAPEQAVSGVPELPTQEQGLEQEQAVPELLQPEQTETADIPAEPVAATVVQQVQPHQHQIVESRPEQTEVEAAPVEAVEIVVQAEQPSEAGQQNDTTLTENASQSEAAAKTVEADEPEEETAAASTAKPVFEHLEAVPVRVAQTAKAPVAAALEEPEAPEQLTGILNQAMEEGVSHVEITLTPENLGKLTVELTREKDGTLSVILTASTPKAAELLERHSNGLHQLLAVKNSGEVEIEVRGNDEAQRQQQQQQNLNPNDSNENAKEQQAQEQERRRQEQEREEQRQQLSGVDFMQRLRLGLTSAI